MSLSLPELEGSLRRLSGDRPVFHSEADFQHALAWQIHEDYPELIVRLEYKPIAAERVYVDIWLRRGGTATAIELKYPTRGLTVSVAGEDFSLRNQAAQDITRYDFIRDVAWVERVVAASDQAVGFAFLLTNDSAYWKSALKSSSVDAAFRISEGRRLSGRLGWAVEASAGTRKGRETELSLLNEYVIGWSEYSALPGSYGRFRYVIVEAVRETRDI